MKQPTRFEDEFPATAAFLMSIYAREPQHTCPRGHRHFLPYWLHVGRDYCQHIPFEIYCRRR